MKKRVKYHSYFANLFSFKKFTYSLVSAYSVVLAAVTFPFLTISTVGVFKPLCYIERDAINFCAICFWLSVAESGYVSALYTSYTFKEYIWTDVSYEAFFSCDIAYSHFALSFLCKYITTGVLLFFNL